jgi:hypothetical protein
LIDVGSLVVFLNATNSWSVWAVISYSEFQSKINPMLLAHQPVAGLMEDYFLNEGNFNG